MEIDIRLDSFNKTYNSGDNITGTLNIKDDSDNRNTRWANHQHNYLLSLGQRNEPP